MTLSITILSFYLSVNNVNAFVDVAITQKLRTDFKSRIKCLKTRGDEDQREPHTRRPNRRNKLAYTFIHILIYGRSGAPLPASLRSVPAYGHLLHGGYFLCQTGNHSKEPQIYEPICHSKVHHLQDLKQKTQERRGSASVALVHTQISHQLWPPEVEFNWFWWFHEDFFFSFLRKWER